MFNTINAKLLLFSVICIVSITLSVIFSYLIAVSSIKSIMKTDVASVADAMEKNLKYIAETRPDAYKEQAFKKMIYSVKVGKSGYPFMLDAQGTLVVHPKDEGRNLAGQKHIDYIRNHREGGVYEYTAVTTGQDKVVAYRYIDKWELWIVPGVNKADYFEKLQSAFFKWNMLFAGVLIVILTLISRWIIRTITNPLKGMLRIYRDAGNQTEGGKSGESGMTDTREIICQLLDNLLYRRRGKSSE